MDASTTDDAACPGGASSTSGATTAQLPVWTSEQIAENCQFATDLAAEEMLRRRRTAADTFLKNAEADAELLFSVTQDLRDLEAAARNARTLEVLPFLVLPHLSQDDVKTLLAAQDVYGMNCPQDQETSSRVACIIGELISSSRFPWLDERDPRSPTPEERAAAVSGVATAMATERARTADRSEKQQQQEEAVRQAVLAAGYREISGLPANLLDLARFEPGDTCGEWTVGPRGRGSKADRIIVPGAALPVLIESKYSGSVTNSFKRVVHEPTSKLSKWSDALGAGTFTMVVVVGGVGKPDQVEALQEKGIHVIWDHDLTPLTKYLAAVRGVPPYSPPPTLF